MPAEESFPVEDFINSITSQLDRVQDALRFKALNRPLTYALKDFSLDLQVFVEMDIQGNVRFRTAGPNETGSSTVRLGFTTITKPMIEENTVSLAMTRSPMLGEIGLTPQEQLRLEQLGVRNAAQLRRLGSTAGASTVSRLSGIPLERLRQALSLGRPQVRDIQPSGGQRASDGPPLQIDYGRPGGAAPGGGGQGSGASPAQQPPGSRKPRIPLDVIQPERMRGVEAVRRGRSELAPSTAPPAAGSGPGKEEALPAAGEKPMIRAARPDFDQPVSRAIKPGAENLPMIAVRRGAPGLTFSGSNLLGEAGPPQVRLNRQPLEIAGADEDQVTVALPLDLASGLLEIELPDGQVLNYALNVDEPVSIQPGANQDNNDDGYPTGPSDPWAPMEEA